MKKINLRELYPDAYTTDFFVNVTEDVLETIRASERAEAAYERKMYRYKAQYSLDCENGIENAVLTKPQTPEMVLEEKQLQKQVYSGNTLLPRDRHDPAYIENQKPWFLRILDIDLDGMCKDKTFRSGLILLDRHRYLSGDELVVV